MRVNTQSAAKPAIMFSLFALHVRFSRHRFTITVISLKARAALLTHSNSSSSPSPRCCACHVCGSAPIRGQQSQRRAVAPSPDPGSGHCPVQLRLPTTPTGGCFDEVGRIFIYSFKRSFYWWTAAVIRRMIAVFYTRPRVGFFCGGTNLGIIDVEA